MGLQSHLNDVASDSIPILLLALVAGCVSHLRSLLIGLCKSVGLSSFDYSDEVADDDDGSEDSLLGLGSGLAGLIVLSEQLNDGGGCGGGGGGGDRCVVCLCRPSDGDLLRRLTCGHVFHKKCLDAWLDQMKFSCPLCRSPLVSESRVDQTERRVARELAAWFASR